MRNYKLDTIKGLLIYFVVFGHLLELVNKDNNIARGIYILIYCIHMPIFVFTTGYFAKCNIKKLICNIVYPYILFSVLYQVAAVYWWKELKAFSFTKPYWLLWYLLATLLWSLSIPLWEKLKREWEVVFILLTVVCACMAGYVEAIGRTFALSRILVFFPFFVLGKYWNQEGLFSRKKESALRFWKIAIGIVMLLVFGIVFCRQASIRYTWLYEATPYSVSHYYAGIRLLHLTIGFLGVLAVMLCLPEKEIRWISGIGRNTMPIYLFHGFLIKVLAHWHVVNYLGIVDKKLAAVMLCALTAASIIFVLSLKIIQSASVLLLSPWCIWKNTR